MINIKKFLFMIFIISTGMFVTLSACSSPNSNESESMTNIQSDLADENLTLSGDELNKEISEFQAANADYGGYKFRILGYESFQGSWKAAEISEIYAEEENGDPINDAVYRRNRIVEELYNIEIALVPLSYGDRGSHSGIALRPILAGEDAYDAALTIGTSLPPILGRSSQTIDLFQVPGIDFEASWWDQNSVNELSIANRLHVVTGDLTLYSALASGMFYANKTLIQEYELADPYNLVRENKWTWDSVYKMAREVTLDTNGDGIMDITVDQYGIGVENMSVGNTVRGAGERITRKDENDIPYLAVNTPKAVQAMDIVFDVVFNKDISINGSELVGYQSMYFNFFLPKFQENRLLFMFHALFTSLSMRDMESDFAILPPPMLDETQGRFYSCINETWGTYMWIPTTNTDHARTGTVLHALGYYSQQYVTPAFLDVTVTHKVIRDEDSIEMLDIILKSRTYDMGTIYNWGDLEDRFFRRGIPSRTNTFASDYERAEAAVTTAMERTLTEMLEN